MGLWWQIGIGLWIGAVSVGAFLVSPIKGLVGTPIVFFHVPCARVSGVGFLLAAWYGGRYLWRRDPEDDVKSACAAELGFLFAIIATLTGSVFSRLNWGHYWDWDPRQTSALFLCIIYAAYLALRSAMGGNEARGRLCAVYAIVAFFGAIFLIFVYPYLPGVLTLHPPLNMFMSPLYRRLREAGESGFLFLWIWLFRLAVGVTKTETRMREESWETAPTYS